MTNKEDSHYKNKIGAYIFKIGFTLAFWLIKSPDNQTRVLLRPRFFIDINCSEQQIGRLQYLTPQVRG